MFQVTINNYETWLVCGGRDFTDQGMFDDVMGRLLEMWGCPERIVHGACPTGADKMADAFGRRIAVEVIAVPANWAANGKAAGPMRNAEMLAYQKPRRVIAFPGGRGTADMVRQAKEAKEKYGTDLDVVEIKLNEH